MHEAGDSAGETGDIERPARETQPLGVGQVLVQARGFQWTTSQTMPVANSAPCPSSMCVPFSTCCCTNPRLNMYRRRRLQRRSLIHPPWPWRSSRQRLESMPHMPMPLTAASLRACAVACWSSPTRTPAPWRTRQGQQMWATALQRLWQEIAQTPVWRSPASPRRPTDP